MEGWLKKKGENLGTLFWKDRWFKEENGKLVYYTNSSCTVTKGSIDIKTIKDVRPRMHNFGWTTGSGFEVITEGRIYCLLASKEAEQLAWVNGLLARIDKKQKFVVTKDEWIASLKAVARAVVVTVVNKTDFVLVREGFKLHGAGQDWKKFPPEKLAPNETAVFGSCSSTLLTGTCASVTFKAKIDLDEAIVWLRWHNPFRKLLVTKKALFEAPSRLCITCTEDLAESGKLFVDSDLYRIRYEITFDPQLNHSTSNATETDRMTIQPEEEGAVEADWVALDKQPHKDGPTLVPTVDGQLGQVMQTSYGQTKYYADWIPVLKAASRSVLIIFVNNTKYTCERSDWSLSRGLWRAIPAEKVSAKSTACFGTSSHGAGVLGMRSGTIGSVTYVVKFATGDFIMTFDWTNHLMWGIHNTVAITSNVSDPAASHLNVLTDSNDDSSCEVTFTLNDDSLDPADGTNASPSNNSATSSSSSSANPSTSAASPSGDTTAAANQTPSKVIKKTVPKRIQEEGYAHNHTGTFSDLRRGHLEKKKADLRQIETDLELVANNLYHGALQKQQEGGFFNSIFSKDPTLEQEAENVATSRTAAPLSTAVCPITGIAFASKEEKKYCYICGRLVHKSVIVTLPYPPAIEVKDLKKPAPLILACLECNDVLTQAERPMAWRATLAKAEKAPVKTIQEGLMSKRKAIKDSLQDLRKFIITKDKDAPVIVNKINTLLLELDALQMQLFALNEHVSRAEQKINNTMAPFYISNWKEDTLPELQALKEAL